LFGLTALDCLVPANCFSASPAESKMARFMLFLSLRSHPNPFQMLQKAAEHHEQSPGELRLLSVSLAPSLDGPGAWDQGVCLQIDPKGPPLLD